MVQQAQKCPAEKGFSAERKRATLSLRCPVDSMGSRGPNSIWQAKEKALPSFSCQETCQINSSELKAKVKSKLFERHVCCTFKPGYSRVRIFSIPVASGKRLLELQVSAQYATVLDTHNHCLRKGPLFFGSCQVTAEQHHLQILTTAMPIASCSASFFC